MLPDQPFIATQIFCGVEVGGEALEVAGRAKIVVVDSCGASCLAFGGLGFVETVFSGSGSVLPVAMDQVGALVEV